MLLYYNSKASLYIQYKNTFDILENEKSNLNRKYDTLLECLNSFNAVLQSDNDLDDLEAIVVLLEVFKELFNYAKVIKKDLDTLFDEFNTIFPRNFNNSTIVSREIKSKIYKYNLKAKTCQQKISEFTQKYDGFIMQYISISLPVLQASSEDNLIDKDMIKIHDELAHHANHTNESVYGNLSENNYSDFDDEGILDGDDEVEDIIEDTSEYDKEIESDSKINYDVDLDDKVNSDDTIKDDVDLDNKDNSDDTIKDDVDLDNKDNSDYKRLDMTTLDDNSETDYEEHTILANNMEVDSDTKNKSETTLNDNLENDSNDDFDSKDDTEIELKAEKYEHPSTKFTLDLVNSNGDYPTLVISEKYQKVYLPFSKSELKSKIKKNKKYKSYQDVIDAEYTLPLSRFKNPKIARFQEAYNLMKKKEKASLLESIDLALEVSFNNSLYPAVITACNSLDELDTYIDCIEKNELDKFDKFKVVFEVAPL